MNDPRPSPASRPLAREDWLAAKELFTRLCDVTPAERVAVLDSMTPDDPVRGAAERLLRSLESADGFLEEPTGVSRGGGFAGLDEDEPGRVGKTAPAMPSSIGPYEPVEVLGEGGFGIVYRARQRYPVDREVAVKLLRSGLESQQVMARFTDERRYLARLDHPDVVRVLDAGTTDDGRMFVVMDLAPGVPITDFVRAEGLPLRDRVGLFVRVCRAVHAVHQRAVIHRDLKPSNILVEMDGSGARPRIIDFGIATALEDADRAGWTRTGAPIGTPRYASPEQARGEAAVDIRSDLYSLGMVLSEVLCGALPRPPATGAESPATPPSRLAGDAGRSRSLRGDLDRIVLKCVAWEPGRRYDSAAGLADDLERYLAGQAVLASPPGRVYLARKFVARHRFATGSALAGLVALVAGLGVSMSATAEANRQRHAAQANAERVAFIGGFLLETIERNADPDARGRDVVLDEAALARMAGEAMEGFEDDPETMLGLLETIGRIQHKIAAFDAAAETLGFAADGAAMVDGGASERTVRLRMQLGETLLNRHATVGRAMEALERAADEGRMLFAPDDPRLLRVLVRMPLSPTGEIERILGLLESNPAATPEDLASALSTLYFRHEYGPTPARGLPYARRWYEVVRDHHGPDHSLTINAMTAYAAAESVHGSTSEALPLLETALVRSIETFGEDHHHTESARRSLATVYGAVGRPDLGLPLAWDYEAQTRRLHGEGSVPHSNAMGVLGTLLMQAGEFASARDALESSLEAKSRHWPAGHTSISTAEVRLAEVLVELGAFDEAEAVAERALGNMRVSSMAYPMALATRSLVRVLQARGMVDEAVVLVAETLSVFEAEGAPERAVETLTRLIEELGES